MGDVHSLNANTTSCYIGDSSNPGFWYSWGALNKSSRWGKTRAWVLCWCNILRQIKFPQNLWANCRSSRLLWEASCRWLQLRETEIDLETELVTEIDKVCQWQDWLLLEKKRFYLKMILNDTVFVCIILENPRAYCSAPISLSVYYVHTHTYAESIQIFRLAFSRDGCKTLIFYWEIFRNLEPKNILDINFS